MKNGLGMVFDCVLFCLMFLVTCSIAFAADTGLLFWDLGLKSVITTQYQQRLPGSDSLDAALRLAPGVPTRFERFYIHGSNTNENRFSVDGFSRTDCLTGLGYMEVSPEIIDSVDITTSAIPADQDNVMGGILNATTRSGTNQWHGIVRLDYVNSEWIDDFENGLMSGIDHEYYTPTLVLDGPVISEKLWFLASYKFYSYTFDAKTIGYYGTSYFDYANFQDVDSEISFSNPYINLLFKPSSDHRFKFSYCSTKSSRTNVDGDLFFSTPAAFIDLEDMDQSWNLDWTWFMGESLKSHVSFGYFSKKLSALPTKQSINPRDAAFYDDYYHQYYNNGASWREDQREVMEIDIDMEWDVDDLLGAHTFKAGVGMESSVRELDKKNPGGAFYSIDQEPVGDHDNPDYYTGDRASREFLLYQGSAETSCNVIELFMQDDWQINDSLKVNLGVRYEMVEYEIDSGTSDVAAWSWGDFHADSWLNSDGTPKSTAPMKLDGLAPRVRIDWNLFNDNLWLIHGFYGRYLNRFDHNLPHMFQPYKVNQTATFMQQYSGPPWTDRNKDGVPDEDYFFDENNWIAGQPEEPRFSNLLDPDLEAEYTDEFVLGVSHQLNTTIKLGLNCIYRKTNNLIEDVGLFLDDEGNIVWTHLGAVNDTFTGLKPGWDFDPRAPYRGRPGYYDEHIYYVTNVDGNDREYSGIEITVEVKDTNWEANMFYTYSKAEGSTTDTNIGVGGLNPFSGLYDTPGTSANLYGELPWSATHNLRLTGAYWFNLTNWYEMSFGANLFYNSGYHYSITMNPPYTYDPDDDDNDIVDPSTWTGYPPYRTSYLHFFVPRGSLELPDHVNVDISWQHQFTLGNYGKLALIFDVINLFDNQEVIGVTRFYEPRMPMSVGTPINWEDPRSYHLSLKYSF